MNHSFRKLLFRVLSAFIFSFSVFGFLYFQCSGKSEELCYISPDAWVFIPIIFFIPALVIQLTAWVITIFMKQIYFSGLISFTILHSVIAFIYLRLWLLFTRQDYSYIPTFDDDFFMLFSGALMGAAVYLFNKTHNYVQK